MLTGKCSIVIEIDKLGTVEPWESHVEPDTPAKRTLATFCRSHIKVITVFFLIFLIVTVFLIVTCAPTCILGPSYFRPISIRATDKPFNVALFGDSLVTGNHAQKFGIFPSIASKISHFLPNFNLNIINYGHGGDGIQALRNRLQNVLVNTIDAIIILWDSDVSPAETPANTAYFRSIYISNVIAVVKEIQSSNSTIHIALAGPIIMGEGPLFTSLTSAPYNSLTDMLNEYEATNRQLAVQLNISYIDMRSAFLSYLPSYRLAYEGCLTIDGEHENANGMTIIAKSVAKQLFDWTAV